MAIARRNSRPIHVDGVDYRWRLGRRRLFDLRTSLAVWTDATPPACLRVTIRGVWSDRDPEWLPQGSGTPVTPIFVADVVRAALVDGWDPKTPGATARIDADPPDRGWRDGEFETHLNSWDRRMRARAERRG